MSKISVSSAPGSGGAWLLQVLDYCTTPDKSWEYRTVNFHTKVNEVLLSRQHHAGVDSDSVISIGNGNYKYNFWVLYLRKRVFETLEYTRIHGHRLILSGYREQTTPRDHFFWLTNQCRFIQTYNYTGQFTIDWSDLFFNDQQAWTRICEFLEHNRVTNYATYSDFVKVLENYKQTSRPLKLSANFNHKSFLLWSLCFLQNRGHRVPFDVFENFGQPVMTDWIRARQDPILEYTKSNSIEI